MADPKDLPKPGKQVRAAVRCSDDEYPKGKSGIIIIRKGKKIKLNTLAKRKARKKKE